MSFYVDYIEEGTVVEKIDWRIRSVKMKVKGHDLRKISSESSHFDLNLESVCLSSLHELHTTRDQESEREKRARGDGRRAIDMNVT